MKNAMFGRERCGRTLHRERRTRDHFANLVAFVRQCCSLLCRLRRRRSRRQQALSHRVMRMTSTQIRVPSVPYTRSACGRTMGSGFSKASEPVIHIMFPPTPTRSACESLIGQRLYIYKSVSTRLLRGPDDWQTLHSFQRRRPTCPRILLLVSGAH